MDSNLFSLHKGMASRRGGRFAACNAGMGNAVPGRDNKRFAHVRLSDVAKKVGVSPITISRALRNPEIVSEDLRQLILRTVDEMGYVPNLAARALASRHSGVVGVITPALHQHAFTDIMTGIEDRLRATDLRVQYANTLYDPDQEVSQLKSFLAQKPAGIIVAGAEYYDALAPLLSAAACPVAHIVDVSQKAEGLVAAVDHYEAGAAATRMLLSKNYRRIAFVGCRRDTRPRRRFEGYADVMRQAGYFDEALVASCLGMNGIGAGRELFSNLVEAAPDVDAVFCQNDDLAVGALLECWTRGLRVPDDIGICGFNDLDYAIHCEPALTTVSIPRYQMGHRVADMLLNAVREEEPGTAHIDFGFQVIERGSTR